MSGITPHFEDKRCIKCNALLFKVTNGRVEVGARDKRITMAPENGIVKTECGCGWESIYVVGIMEQKRA